MYKPEILLSHFNIFVVQFGCTKLLYTDYMEIFSAGWSQAFYEIIVNRSSRLHEENFSQGCRAETSARFELPEMRFSDRLIGLKFPM